MLLILAILLAIQPPGIPIAKDYPNDDGGKIIVHWTKTPQEQEIDGYVIYRKEEGGTFSRIGFIGRGNYKFTDSNTKDGVSYYYQIGAVKDDSVLAMSSISEPSTSSQQWFHTGRVNVLVGVIIYAIILLYFIYHARMGKKLFIRKIPGLEALDEAVGRATEMGRPILYVPGLSSISDVATIASMNILAQVAKKTAEYNTALIVPNRDPVVYTVAREVVKEAYTDAGRPDAFNPDNIYFLTANQFAYAAAVCGTMVREKPATNLLMGMFWAESLILAETGTTTGAIQIGGTDSVHQLPFFIAACDYTLIGEELYAASAYLSHEPLLLGSLKGQDWGKMIILGILIVASVLILLGLKDIYYFFNIG